MSTEEPSLVGFSPAWIDIIIEDDDDDDDEPSPEPSSDASPPLPLPQTSLTITFPKRAAVAPQPVVELPDATTYEDDEEETDDEYNEYEEEEEEQRGQQNSSLTLPSERVVDAVPVPVPQSQSMLSSILSNPLIPVPVRMTAATMVVPASIVSGTGQAITSLAKSAAGALIPAESDRTLGATSMRVAVGSARLFVGSYVTNAMREAAFETIRRAYRDNTTFSAAGLSVMEDALIGVTRSTARVAVAGATEAAYVAGVGTVASVAVTANMAVDGAAGAAQGTASVAGGVWSATTDIVRRRWQGFEFANPLL